MIMTFQKLRLLKKFGNKVKEKNLMKLKTIKIFQMFF